MTVVTKAARRRLALGTAQFGMAYGATNASGRVSMGTVATILGEARAAGIEVLDTARAYGCSEDVLGEILAGDDFFRIITKVPALSGAQDIAGHVNASVESSLSALGRRRLAAILVHHADDLAGPAGDALWAALVDLKQHSVADAIGISLYDCEQARVFVSRFEPDIVQLPFNLFDQRALESGLIEHCRRTGTRIHARSVFLQGILLADPAGLSPHLAAFRDPLNRLRAGLTRAMMTPVDAAMGFASAQAGIECLVVGVTSQAELAQVLSALDASCRVPDPTAYALRDEHLLNPSLWPAEQQGAGVPAQ